MSRIAKLFVLFVSLTGLGVWSGDALAAAKFARVAGNWSTAGTWSTTSCAAAGATTQPTAADDVTICNGINVTVDGAGTAGSVTIATGATATALTLGAAGTLTVTNASGLSGNVIINPSTANVTRSLAVGARTLTVTGSVTINGGTTTGGASNISQLTVTTGTASLGSLVLNAGTLVRNQARVTLTTGKINVTGDVTLTGGTALNTCDALLSVTGASIVGNGINIGGNLNINSTLATTSAVSITVAGGRITVNGAGGVNNGDTVTVGAGIFTVSNAAATFANSNAAIVAATSISTGTLNVAGNLTNATGDTITVTGAGNIFVGGNWSNSGTFTAGTSTVTFDGAAQQTLTGVTTFNNMTVNNAAGLLLASNITATSAAAGVVTLTSGAITTGVNNTLIVTRPCATPSVTRTTGYVIGNLQLSFPTLAGTTTCTYHVGDSIGYAPVTVALTGATAGTLTGRVGGVGGDHPDTIANISGIDQTKSANHYWTLTPGTLATYTSYAATLQFCAVACTNAERDATATVGNFIVAKKFPVATGSWILPTPLTRTATTIQVTGVTSATGFGEFAVGELLTGVYKGVNQLIDLREVY